MPGIGQFLDFFSGQPGEYSKARDSLLAARDGELLPGRLNVCLLGQIREGLKRHAVAKEHTRKSPKNSGDCRHQRAVSRVGLLKWLLTDGIWDHFSDSYREMVGAVSKYGKIFPKNGKTVKRKSSFFQTVIIPGAVRVMRVSANFLS
jgi:hypothetical protein